MTIPVLGLSNPLEISTRDDPPVASWTAREPALQFETIHPGEAQNQAGTSDSEIEVCYNNFVLVLYSVSMNPCCFPPPNNKQDQTQAAMSTQAYSSNPEL